MSCKEGTSRKKQKKRSGKERVDMTLKELGIGQSAMICKVGGEGALRQHLLDMGMIPGAEITVVKFAPMGDPMRWSRSENGAEVMKDERILKLQSIQA